MNFKKIKLEYEKERNELYVRGAIDSKCEIWGIKLYQY